MPLKMYSDMTTAEQSAFREAYAAVLRRHGISLPGSPAATPIAGPPARYADMTDSERAAFRKQNGLR